MHHQKSNTNRFLDLETYFSRQTSSEAVYAQRECCSAAPSVGEKVSGRKTAFFNFLMYRVTRCASEGIP